MSARGTDSADAVVQAAVVAVQAVVAAAQAVVASAVVQAVVASAVAREAAGTCLGMSVFVVVFQDAFDVFSIATNIGSTWVLSVLVNCGCDRDIARNNISFSWDTQSRYFLSFVPYKFISQLEPRSVIVAMASRHSSGPGIQYVVNGQTSTTLGLLSHNDI